MSKLMFLEIDNIRGECQRKGLEGKIEIVAWGWGINKLYEQGESKKSFKADTRNITIRKWLDISSPGIIQNITSLKPFSEIRLMVYNENARDRPEAEYIMCDGKVTSFSTGGSCGEERLTENLIFRFEKIKIRDLHKNLEEDKNILDK